MKLHNNYAYTYIRTYVSKCIIHTYSTCIRVYNYIHIKAPILLTDIIAIYVYSIPGSIFEICDNAYIYVHTCCIRI